MLTDSQLQRNQEIFDTLNKTKKQEPKSPEFWLWSDLASLYPKFFDKSVFIPTDWFTDRIHTTITQNVQAFDAMIEKPVHIQTININNVFQDTTPHNIPELNTLNKNKDQKLTRLACEYLFKQYFGAEFTQAYFLFPNTTINELNDKIDDIKIYRRHQDIHNIIKQTASIILRVTGRTKATVCEIYNNTWATFFNTQNLDKLKEQYNIQHSLFDNMQLDFSCYPNQWDYIYNMFRDMKIHLDEHQELELEDVINQGKESAQIQRYMLQKHTGKTPEEFLTKVDLGVKSKEIDMQRKLFWFQNYKKSL